MTPPLFIGIDPGYATCGLVILDSEGVVLRSLTIETKTSHGNDVTRCRRVAHIIGQDLIYYIDQPVVIVMEEYVSSRGSRSAAQTHISRGIVDGMLLHLFGIPVPLIVPNSRCKAFCHPTGVATDKGRTKDLEYRAALNMLDRVVRPDNLKMIAEPVLECDANTWKQGRLHTLDAAALAGIGRAVVQQGLKVFPHQRKIANEFLGLPAACPVPMRLRTL